MKKKNKRNSLKLFEKIEKEMVLSKLQEEIINLKNKLKINNENDFQKYFEGLEEKFRELEKAKEKFEKDSIETQIKLESQYNNILKENEKNKGIIKKLTEENKILIGENYLNPKLINKNNFKKKL